MPFISIGWIACRELSFKKGDIIYIRREIDKNWYEGEHNAMVGLLPSNYVEVRISSYVLYINVYVHVRVSNYFYIINITNRYTWPSLIAK